MLKKRYPNGDEGHIDGQPTAHSPGQKAVERQDTEVPFYRALRFRDFLFTVIMMSVIFLVTWRACIDSMKVLQSDMMSDRLQTDILFLYEDISQGAWHLEDNGMLYKGFRPIGDGTQENANIKPFTDFEAKTGTFCYAFKIDDEKELGKVHGGENAISYDEGHFIRVAGSTPGPNGESIVGTYMSKEVSDILDAEGSYKGEANVAGSMIYCVYNTVENGRGEVIGAIVLGRGIDELNNMVLRYASLMIFVLVIVFLVYAIFHLMMTDRIVRNIHACTDYVKQIEDGTVPETDLTIKGRDEVTVLVHGINTMTMNLRETEKLRHEAETDPLTQIPNRLGLNRLVRRLFKDGQHHRFGISMIDIDYFKQFNDNYGHQAGDGCIKVVSEQISDIVQQHEGAYCARYGGDEFLMLFRDVPDDEIEAIAKELKERVQALKIKHEYSKVSPIVTLSHGICISDGGDHKGFDVIMQEADQALYDVKEKTRNGYHIRYII